MYRQPRSNTQEGLQRALQSLQGVQGVQTRQVPSNYISEYIRGLEPQRDPKQAQGLVQPEQTPAVPVTSQGFTSAPTNVNTDEYFKQLADVESGGSYTAYNKGSGAYGKYQFIPSTEADMMKKMGITQEYARSPEGQEDMIKRFTADNKSKLVRAGYKPTNMNLWLAHNQGLGGAKAILSGGDVNMRNIRSNIPGGRGTVQDYLNYWKGKFGGSNQTYTLNNSNSVNPTSPMTYSPSGTDLPVKGGLTQDDYSDLDDIMRSYGLPTRARRVF